MNCIETITYTYLPADRQAKEAAGHMKAALAQLGYKCAVDEASSVAVTVTGTRLLTSEKKPENSIDPR